MAAKTPSTTYRESLGSATLFIATFTDIDNDDTYASGLSTNVIGYWFNCTLADTAAKDVHVAVSSGTFTFSTGEDNITGTLYILARA